MGDQPRRKGSLRGERGQRAACGRQDRRTSTEGLCHLRAETRAPADGPWERTGVAAWKQPEAAGAWHCLQPGVHVDRARTCVPSAIVNRHVRGGLAHHSSPTLGTLTAGTLRLYELWEHASVGPPMDVGPTSEPSAHSCATCGLTLPLLPPTSRKRSICGTPKWVTGSPVAGARPASAAAGFVGTPT